MAQDHLLTRACTACGAELSHGARFCSACGARIRRAGGSERRILTLMFADVVGSTELASRLELEDYTAILERFRDLAHVEIARRGGHPLQHYGDGVLAAFGLEIDAEDAAAAGLSAALALAQAAPLRLDGTELRVGLNSGPVLCSSVEGERPMPEVTGLDLNLAARVAEAAAPGTVMATEAVLRAAGRITRVTCDPLVPRSFRGLARETAVARIRDIGGAQAAATTPLVDRDATIRTIMSGEAGGAAGGEACRAFLVTGAAGLGKTALRDALLALERPATDRIVLDARANLVRSPLYPFAEWLRARFGAELGGPSGLAPEALAGLADLMGRREPDLEGTSAALRREQRIAAVAALVLALMAERPTALHVDDLHWADADTRAVVERILAAGIPQGSRLVLYARPEPDLASLGDSPGLVTLTLTPLSDDASDRVVAAGRAEALPPETRARIVAAAEGNPLYLRALADAALRNGGTLGPALPEDVEATLQSNIAATGPLRRVLQTASVIGRRCDRSLLAALLEEPAEKLAPGLAALQEAGLVTSAGREIVFAHALLRDAAYEMMPPSRRRSLHRRFVHVLRAEAPALCAAQPEWLADHALLSGDAAEAIEPCLEAGVNFLATAHFELAHRYLAAAAEAVEAVPGAAARRIPVLTLLASAAVQRFGFAHPDVEASYHRLDAALSGEGAVSGDRMRALYGLFAHRMIGGHVRACAPMVARMAAAADPAKAEDRLLHLVNVAALNFYAGRFHAALAAAAEVEEIYDTTHHRRLFLETGADPLVSVLSARMHILARRGEADAARAVRDRAMGHLGQIGARAQEPWLRVLHAQALQAAGSADAGRSDVAAAIDLADRQGAAFWSLTGRIWAATFEVAERPTANGCATLEALLEAAQGIGVGIMLPRFWSVLAEARLAQGDGAGAEGLSLRAVRRVAQAGEGIWAPEVWAARAGILAARGDPAAPRAADIAAAYRRRSGLADSADPSASVPSAGRA